MAVWDNMDVEKVKECATPSLSWTDWKGDGGAGGEDFVAIRSTFAARNQEEVRIGSGHLILPCREKKKQKFSWNFQVDRVQDSVTIYYILFTQRSRRGRHLLKGITLIYTLQSWSKKHKLQNVMRKDTNFLNLLLRSYCWRALHILSIHNADCYNQIKKCWQSSPVENSSGGHNTITIKIKEKTNAMGILIILLFPLMLFIK